MNEQSSARHTGEQPRVLTDREETALWAAAFGIRELAGQTAVEEPTAPTVIESAVRSAAPVFHELSLDTQEAIRSGRKHTYFS